MENLPPKMRVKIMRINSAAYPKPVPKLPTSILKALERADELHTTRTRKLEENLKLKQEEAQQYTWTRPEPAIAEVTKEELKTLINLLGEEITQKPVTIKHGGQLYILSIEYPCG